MIYTELTKKATCIAFEAHKGQADKSCFQYIHYPLYLAEQMDSEDEVIIALLHDVVEDTEWNFEALEREGFPQSVISTLKLLTHDDGCEYAEYTRHIKSNPLAVRVKVADLRHNSDSSRLSALPLDIATRLQRKYSVAMEILSEVL